MPREPRTEASFHDSVRCSGGRHRGYFLRVLVSATGRVGTVRSGFIWDIPKTDRVPSGRVELLWSEELRELLTGELIRLSKFHFELLDRWRRRAQVVWQMLGDLISTDARRAEMLVRERWRTRLHRYEDLASPSAARRRRSQGRRPPCPACLRRVPRT